MNDKAMVVLSGGQDSTTCGFWAVRNFEEVHAITFDYGQRHARELEAASIVGKIMGVKSHTVIKLGPILSGRSPLTNPNEELELYSNFEQMDKTIGDRVELTFVPMRNALFLTVAANNAICRDIYNLITGVCQADNANYPDCRESFIVAQETAINEALGLPATTIKTMRILTPLMHLPKYQSVLMAHEMSNAYTALAFTHTAYDGQYPPVGRDHATILRAKGFEDANLPDPLVLRAWHHGLMALPDTSNYHDMSYNNLIIKCIDDMQQEFSL